MFRVFVILYILSLSSYAKFKDFCKKADADQVARLKQMFETAKMLKAPKKLGIDESKIGVEHIRDGHLIPDNTLEWKKDSFVLKKGSVQELLEKVANERPDKPITSFYTDVAELDEVVGRAKMFIPSQAWLEGKVRSLKNKIKMPEETNSHDINFAIKQVHHELSQKYLDKNIKLSLEEFSNTFLPKMLKDLGVDHDLAYEIYKKYARAETIEKSQFSRLQKLKMRPCAKSDTSHVCYDISQGGKTYEVKACKSGQSCKADGVDTSNGITSIYPKCLSAKFVPVSEGDIIEKNAILIVKKSIDGGRGVFKCI